MLAPNGPAEKPDPPPGAPDFDSEAEDDDTQRHQRHQRPQPWPQNQQHGDHASLRPVPRAACQVRPVGAISFPPCAVVVPEGALILSLHQRCTPQHPSACRNAARLRHQPRRWGCRPLRKRRCFQQCLTRCESPRHPWSLIGQATYAALGQKRRVDFATTPPPTLPHGLTLGRLLPALASTIHGASGRPQGPARPQSRRVTSALRRHCRCRPDAPAAAPPR